MGFASLSTWPYVAVIIGLKWLVLLSEKPSSTIRIVGQQVEKWFSTFSTSTLVTLYLVCGEEEGSKNYQEIKRGGG